MSRLFRFALPLVIGLLVPAAGARATVVEFTTPLGNFQIQLLDAIAPNTVANFLQYVNTGLYQNAAIHRCLMGNSAYRTSPFCTISLGTTRC